MGDSVMRGIHSMLTHRLISILRTSPELSQGAIYGRIPLDNLINDINEDVEGTFVTDTKLEVVVNRLKEANQDSKRSHQAGTMG